MQPPGSTRREQALHRRARAVLQHARRGDPFRAILRLGGRPGTQDPRGQPERSRRDGRDAAVRGALAGAPGNDGGSRPGHAGRRHADAGAVRARL